MVKVRLGLSGIAMQDYGVYGVARGDLGMCVREYGRPAGMVTFIFDDDNFLFHFPLLYVYYRYNILQWITSSFPVRTAELPDCCCSHSDICHAIDCYI